MKINVGDKIISLSHNWVGIVTGTNYQSIYIIVNDREYSINKGRVKQFLLNGKWELVSRNALIRMKERLINDRKD